MNCPKCGLPQMHGFVGYAGPQCKCQWANPIQCGPVFTAIPEDELKQLREQIATMTRQCDLALEAIARRRIFSDNLAGSAGIAEMTLDIIKESEAK